jgi:hypothetical protein
LFEEGEEPFYWTECVPPEQPTGGAAGMGVECPGWYGPSARVSGYEEKGYSGAATVTIERELLEEIRSDIVSLYVCDDARYVEYASDWVFERVEAGDLLFELGIREGDRNAVVQGFDPRTMTVTTGAFALDSIGRMQAAVEGLGDPDGVKVAVERSGVVGGTWVVWVSIE